MKKPRKLSVYGALRRAIDGARTRGLDLGKVARYQLRHYRIQCVFSHTQVVSYHLTSALSTVYFSSVSQALMSFSKFQAAFAGLVDGRQIAGRPILSAVYFK